MQSPDAFVSPVISDHNDWKIEEHNEDNVLSPIELVEFHEIYSRDFASHPHMNFIGLINNETHCVVSVLKNPIAEYPKTTGFFNLGPSYKALLTDSDGYEEFILHNLPLPRGGIDPLPVFEHFLNSRIVKKDLMVYSVNSKQFISDLIHLERKFSRKVRTMKIAVLYVKPGQSSIKEIFQNQINDSSRFFTFMEQISQRIQMETWKGYRGDMGTSGDDIGKDSFYTEWKGIKVMLHVAPYMNAEQHRRLVGNDIAVIIYYDEDDTSNGLQLFPSGDLGIVPHIFMVVQPHATDDSRYRVGFFRRTTVPKVDPQIPSKNCYLKLTNKVSSKNLKDFILTKIHNGLFAAQSVSPLNRLYTVPRREALKDLGAKYPKLQNNNIFVEISGPIGNISGALGGAAGAIGNTLGNTITGVLGVYNTEERPNPNTPKLKIKVYKGIGLPSKDNNGLDPYLKILFMGKELKTKVAHKSVNPQWDEELEFEYPDDDSFEEIHIICMDWEKVGGHDYMGEYHIYVKDILLNEKVRYPLLSTTLEESYGEVELEFCKVDPRAVNPLNLKNLPERGGAKGKRSPRGKDEHVINNRQQVEANKRPLDSIIENSRGAAYPKEMMVTAAAAVNNISKALSKLPRAYSEKEKKKTLRKNQFDDEDFSITDDNPMRNTTESEKNQREFRRLNSRDDSGSPAPENISENPRSYSPTINPLYQNSTNASTNPLYQTSPAGLSNIPQRPVKPAPVRFDPLKRRTNNINNLLGNNESESETLWLNSDPLEVKRVTLAAQANNENKEMSENVPKRVTLGLHTKSLSSDKINKLQPKKPQLANIPELAQILDEVKSSVEELIMESLQENVNKESALKAATNMRSNLQKLTEIIEAETDDSQLKENTLQMMTVAKALLKICLELVKHKLAGNDAKHLLPPLKQSSAEFTQYILIVTKLV